MSINYPFLTLSSSSCHMILLNRKGRIWFGSSGMMVSRLVKCWVGAFEISLARWKCSSLWPSSKYTPCSGSMILVPEGMGLRSGSLRFRMLRLIFHFENITSSAEKLMPVSFLRVGSSARDLLLVTLGCSGGTYRREDDWVHLQYTSCR